MNPETQNQKLKLKMSTKKTLVIAFNQFKADAPFRYYEVTEDENENCDLTELSEEPTEAIYDEVVETGEGSYNHWNASKAVTLPRHALIKPDQEIKFQYFTATLTGYNGSNGREIAKAEGCWDTEAEAQAALDAACDKKRQSWADGMGEGDEVIDDRFRGWLGDYQRTLVSFTVIPTVGEKLAHGLRKEVLADEMPDWSDAEIEGAE